MYVNPFGFGLFLGIAIGIIGTLTLAYYLGRRK